MKQQFTKTCGRPAGKRFDRRLDVRFPEEMLRCLKKRARELRLSKSEFIRQCVESALAGEAKKLIGVVRDENASGRMKLTAIQRLDEIFNATMACSDYGLQIARAKAKIQAAKKAGVRVP